MRPFPAAVWLLPVVLAAAGCGEILELPPDPDDATPGTIAGRLVQAEAGRAGYAAVADGRVSIQGTSLQTRTGPDGRFLLEGVVQRTGTLLLQADSNGDGAWERQKQLTLASIGAGPGRQVSLGDVAVVENAQVAGRVLLADVPTRGGHRGSVVFVPEKPYATETADDGTFVLSDLPEGAVRLSLFHAGYDSTTVDGIELRGGERFNIRDVELALGEAVSEPGRVTGRLSFTPPLEDTTRAHVQLERSGGAPVDGAVAADGAFAIEGIPPGLHAVRAFADGYADVRVPNVLVLEGRETAVAPMVLGAGSGGADAGTAGDAGADFDAGLVDAGPDACTDEGATCQPADPCHVGRVSCSGTRRYCDDTFALREPGATCLPGKVCSPSGDCLACVEDASCRPFEPCHVGATRCATGRPLCDDTFEWHADGTICDPGKVCLQGTCSACPEGDACDPGATCHTGRWACGSGTPTCLDLGPTGAEGAACGGGKFCRAGACVPPGISVVSGAGQSGLVTQPLPETVRFRVTDSSDASLLVGVPVTLAGPRGAVVTPSPAITDALGEASVTIRLGPVAGAQSFVASAPGAGSVAVGVTATPPDPRVVLPVANVARATVGGSDPTSGPALETHFNAPAGLAMASDGTLYVADPGAYVVRRIAPDGHTDVVAGSFVPGTTGDGGPAIEAMFSAPYGIALHEASRRLFIADAGEATVRVVNLSTGLISRFAGGGADSGAPWGDGGPSLAANLSIPVHLAVAPTGHLLIADIGHSRLRRVDLSSNVISTLVAPGNCDGSPLVFVGCGGSNWHDSGCRATFDSSGVMWFAGVACGTDVGSGYVTVVLRRGTDGKLARVAGFSPGVDAPGVGALVSNFPFTVVPVPTTNGVFLVQPWTSRLRLIERATGRLYTASGDGTDLSSGDTGPAGDARWDRPFDAVFAPDGSLVVSEFGGRTVRRVTAAATWSTGSVHLETAGGAGQTALVSALPELPFSVRVTDDSGSGVRGLRVRWSADDSTTLFSPDGYTGADGLFETSVRVGLSTGTRQLTASVQDVDGREVPGSPVTLPVTVTAPAAGTALTLVNVEGVQAEDGGTGAAAATHVYNPAGLAVAADGTVYVGTYARVLAVTPPGGVSVLAGGTSPGFGGDGGPATSAQLSSVMGLALDTARNRLLLADWANNRIRAIHLGTGTITTVAGGGTAQAPGYGDGGPGTSAQVFSPYTLAVQGNAAYFNDFGLARLRRLDLVTGRVSEWITTQGACTDVLAIHSTIGSGAHSGSVVFSADGSAFLSVTACGTAPALEGGAAYAVVRRSASGQLTLVAGNASGANTPAAGLLATDVTFSTSPGVALDGQGRLVLVQYSEATIWRVEADGRLTLLVGTGERASGADFAPANSSPVNLPWALAPTPSGHIVFTEHGGPRVRLVW